MIELREISKKGIEKLVNKRESLEEFVKELQSHKNKIANLKAEQENKFDFERANQLNALIQTLEQAQSVYDSKKKELERTIQTSTNTKLRIGEDVLAELKRDKEITNEAKEITQDVVRLRKRAESFKNIVTEKKFKIIDEIEDSADADISELLGSAENISVNQFISINELIKFIDQYASIENVNVRD
ncbi:hypothetical protein [Aerococcus sp.]|uniref:hypothetical protein n=1 Tax=Aerococcus sp. TaxID=1872398 RepID=UPI0025BF8FC1|nr:hypothetical protein [Aerococcus sp.]MBR2130372.1 hypothetical protein [Aerococcus sp.]